MAISSSGWLGGKYYLQSLYENLIGNQEFRDRWEVVQVGGEPEFFPGTKRIARGDKKKVGKIFWRYECDIVFPYTPPHPWRLGAAKAIGWIYDLQHLDMPELCDAGEKAHRDKYFSRTLQNTALTIVSSMDTKQRLVRVDPSTRNKVQVLNFSAKIKWDECNEALLKHEKGRADDFFLCPYQLWKHKNHRTLLEAALICRSHNFSPPIICTGETSDYRNPDYPKKLLEDVREMGLSEQIKFLGRVKRSELLALMIRAKALILPSLYEGWSTVLEEAKALGKNCLASDIPVHREQNHDKCHYFDPNNAHSLALLMLKKWIPLSVLETRRNCEKYQEFRSEVGDRFSEILNQVLHGGVHRRQRSEKKSSMPNRNHST